MPIFRGKFGRAVTDEVWMERGFIYLAKNSKGQYKIGYSGDLKDRLSGLKSKLKDRNIKFIHLIKADDMPTGEKRLHAKYHEKRVKKGGEWFNLSIEDVLFIKNITEYKGGEFTTNEA